MGKLAVMIDETSATETQTLRPGAAARPSGRWSRYAPLNGVLFVVLVLVGGPVLEGSAPRSGASAAQVIAFYAAHRGRERAGVVVLALAFVAFLFFAAALRASLAAPGLTSRGSRARCSRRRRCSSPGRP